MFLLRNTDFLYSEILRQPTSVGTRTLANLAEVSYRQAASYEKNKRIPLRAKNAVMRKLTELGYPLPSKPSTNEEFRAQSWRFLAQFYLENCPDFFSRTLQLIWDLAERDISYLESIRVLKDESHLEAYKPYLIDSVIPFYDICSKEIISHIESAGSFDDLNVVKQYLSIESFLFLLAHAEADFLHERRVDTSILSMHILDLDSPTDSPVKLFFKLWLKTLGLDFRKVIEGRHFDFYDETEDINNQEGMSPEAMAKQFQRYFNEGTKPQWETIDKWAKELCPVLGEAPDAYAALAKVIYAGVLILDRLLEEGKTSTTEQRLRVLRTYEEYFNRHYASISGGQ